MGDEWFRFFACGRADANDQESTEQQEKGAVSRGEPEAFDGLERPQEETLTETSVLTAPVLAFIMLKTCLRWSRVVQYGKFRLSSPRLVSFIDIPLRGKIPESMYACVG